MVIVLMVFVIKVLFDIVEMMLLVAARFAMVWIWVVRVVVG